MVARVFALLVAVAVLGVTAGLGTVRQTASEESYQRAMRSGEDHFCDLGMHASAGAKAVSTSFERVFVGTMALVGKDTSVSLASLNEHIELLQGNDLPGHPTYFYIKAGSDPAWVDGNERSPIRFASNDIAPDGLWAGTLDTDSAFVVLGFTDPSGNALAAAVMRSGLLSQEGMGDDMHSHGVRTRFAPKLVNSFPTLLTDRVLPMGSVDLMNTLGNGVDNNGTDANAGHGDDADFDSVDFDSAVADSDPAHLHGCLNHFHSGQALFSFEADVEFFAQPWQITSIATTDFLEITPPGGLRTLLVTGSLLAISLGFLTFYLIRRREPETLRRFAEEQYLVGIRSSPLGVVHLDPDGLILAVNLAFEKLIGRSADSLIQTPMADLVPEPRRGQWKTNISEASFQTANQTAEVQLQHSSGQTIWVDQSTTIMPNKTNEHFVLLQLKDTTAQRSDREALQHRALHDELTGLPNRALLEDRLAQAIHRVERDGSLAALFFIDIDRFKIINDTWGHGVGDELLILLAERLEAVCRKEDTVARFGGDEFIILCESLQDESEVWLTTERIRDEIAVPFELNNQTISVSLSIGIDICTSGDDVETLIRDADIAMYHAKALGRDQAVLFTNEMRDEILDQDALQRELIGALKHDQLEMYYQPLIEIHENRIIGFEALIRWNHPVRGILSPGAFLPVASKIGILPTLDLWALKTAVSQLIEWTNELPEAADWLIAVNAAPKNFENALFGTIVIDTLTTLGIASNRVILEITEEAILANPNTANAIIKQLHDFGLTIACDDFGSGYSSLSQLAELDFDTLKIDKSLIADIGQSPHKEIVGATLDMAKAIGMDTVAEGVETSEHLALLREMGASHAQGYFFSRPVPASQAQTISTTWI
jgi:diguanylate cyclase (GGDEF)-like protein/PAS domain S-box-containing protein